MFDPETSDFTTLLVYPNPTDRFVTLSSDEVIQSCEVYNILGVLVASSPSSSTTIDLDELPAGEYHMKIRTSKGVANVKVLKK